MGPFLIFFLDTLRGHTVDDGIPSRIQRTNEHCSRNQSSDQENGCPQNDVENGRVVLIVTLGKVPWFSFRFSFRTVISGCSGVAWMGFIFSNTGQ